MEDAHIASEIHLNNGKKAMLFAVFDGHGGQEVSNFAKDNFEDVLTKNKMFENGKF